VSTPKANAFVKHPLGEVDDVEGLASIIGCRVAMLPMKYLGLPLEVSYKSTSIWSDIVEKWKDVWLVVVKGR
jgi:hypothetical protein